MSVDPKLVTQVVAGLAAHNISADKNTVECAITIFNAYQKHPSTRASTENFISEMSKAMATFGLVVDADTLEQVLTQIMNDEADEELRLQAKIKKGIGDLMTGNRHTPEAQMVNDSIGVVDAHLG